MLVINLYVSIYYFLIRNTNSGQIDEMMEKHKIAMTTTSNVAQILHLE
jgi:hypothetical protein